jgi:chromosome segregation ATPase
MFNFGKDKAKEEQEKLGKTIANLSDQVGGLQQELNKKNKEMEAMQQKLQQAQASGAGAAQAAQAQKEAQEALRASQAQMQELQKQIAELSKAKAAAEAAAKAAQAQAAQPGVTNAAAQAQPAAAQAEQAVGAARLAVGVTAWVQNEQGQNLRRRSEPGLEAKVLDGLAVGTQLTLMEGPVSEDGYTWWRVRAKDGREGWVAGEGLVTHG